MRSYLNKEGLTYLWSKIQSKFVTKLELENNGFLTEDKLKTINNQSLLGEGNITIQGGSDGGDTNVIETVKVNGTVLTPDSSKAVDIQSIPASIVTQDTTHQFVSKTEKSAWDNKSNFSGSYFDLTNKPTTISNQYIINLVDEFIFNGTTYS